MTFNGPLLGIKLQAHVARIGHPATVTLNTNSPELAGPVTILPMCGRYRLRDSEAARLATKAGIVDYPTLLRIDRYNVAPTQFNPVVLKPATESHPSLAMFRWGLIPPWAKDLKSAYSTINARSETVATLRTFAEPFKTKHCLVPAGGWYEWRNMEDGKQPYLLTLPDSEPFFFAGLWQKWQPKEAEPIFSFTILTTDANREILSLHDRMPVIVPEDRWLDWLDVKGGEESTALLNGPILDYNRKQIAPSMVPVSRRMSNARNEGAEAAAVVPVNETLELETRGKVLDALESISLTGELPTVHQIAEKTGLPQDKVRDVLEDLEASERVESRPAPHEDYDDEPVWRIAGAAPPEEVPPLNPL